MTMFRIKNQTGRLVILRLNSGKSLFLEPGALSGELPGEEVGNNPMVEKLRERQNIALYEGKSKETQSPAAGDVTRVTGVSGVTGGEDENVEKSAAEKKSRKTKSSSTGGK